jgi:hypothetical protein
MNTKPEIHDEIDLTARSEKKEWAEPQIVLERPLEARADDQPIMFPTPTGRRVNPLSSSSPNCL